MAPSSTKQRLLPGHLAFQEVCVVTQRAWRHYEHFQKLRDDWAIPAVASPADILRGASRVPSPPHP